MVTSLIAAYMSTMSTQMNWGASVLVNDLYKRFLKPDASEREQVWAGRLATPLLMLAACALALVLRDALSSFELLLQIGSGTGLVMLLRWFWWRVNAMAEITAMAVSFLVALAFQMSKGGDGGDFSASQQLLIGVGVTTVAWVLVAFFTESTDKEVLRRFYQRVQPGELGWKQVLEDAEHERVQMRDTKLHSDLPSGLLAAACASVAIWALIYATGYWLYGRPLWALGMGAVAVAAGTGVALCWRRLSLR